MPGGRHCAVDEDIVAQITLKIMTYFEALVRLRSVSLASKHLAVSEHVLMRKIEDFQRTTEIPLYYRQGDEIVVTPVGLQVAERMQHVLTEAHEIELLASRVQPTLTGRFRLGVIPTIAPYLLPALLPRLRREYPQLALEIRETRTKALLGELATGSVDALLLALPVDQPDVAVEPLFDDPAGSRSSARRGRASADSDPQL